MAATVKEIAALTDLFVPTVVQILGNRADRYSKATQQRVRKTARELGYRPNSFARAVRLGRFGQAALLLSTDRGRSYLPPDLFDGLHDSLAEHEMHLCVVKLPDEKLTDAGFVPKILREWCCDGLLVNYTDQIPPKMIELIESSRHPAVWLNTKRDHDCVYPDDFDAGRRLTAMLIERGHRHIAYVDLHFAFDTRTQPKRYSKWDRWTGYEQAMRDAGLAPRRIDAAATALHDVAGIYEFWSNPAGSWLDRDDRPTAVVCYAREDANPIALAAQKLGLRLPQDLAFAAFADRGQAVMPALLPPVAVLPHEELGRKAVEMLMAKIASPTRVQKPVAVRFRLDERGVTGPAGKN
jgi:LacI family transcriptional regulator